MRREVYYFVLPVPWPQAGLAQVASAEVAVAGDPPVLDLDPGPQLVGEPGRVGGQQLVEPLQPVRRRQIPVADPRSTASFPTPRMASIGIHDSDVTQDSTRAMQALQAAGVPRRLPYPACNVTLDCTSIQPASSQIADIQRG